MAMYESQNGTLKFNGETIRLENDILPIKNISYVGYSREDPCPFPFYAIVLIIVGIIFAAFHFIAIGIVLILIGLAWIGFVIFFNENRGGNATIVMNSGDRIHIHSDDDATTHDIIEKLQKCINSHETEPFEFKNISTTTKK